MYEKEVETMTLPLQFQKFLQNFENVCQIFRSKSPTWEIFERISRNLGLAPALMWTTFFCVRRLPMARRIKLPLAVRSCSPPEHSESSGQRMRISRRKRAMCGPSCGHATSTKTSIWVGASQLVRSERQRLSLARENSGTLDFCLLCYC